MVEMSVVSPLHVKPESCGGNERCTSSTRLAIKADPSPLGDRGGFVQDSPAFSLL